MIDLGFQGDTSKVEKFVNYAEKKFDEKVNKTIDRFGASFAQHLSAVFYHGPYPNTSKFEVKIPGYSPQVNSGYSNVVYSEENLSRHFPWYSNDPDLTLVQRTILIMKLMTLMHIKVLIQVLLTT